MTRQAESDATDARTARDKASREEQRARDELERLEKEMVSQEQKRFNLQSELDRLHVHVSERKQQTDQPKIEIADDEKNNNSTQIEPAHNEVE